MTGPDWKTFFPPSINTSVLVFSKDRPWQLSEYLRTLYKYGHGIGPIFVIYKPTEDYVDHYNFVKFKYPTVTFIKETDFQSDLYDTLFNRIKTDYVLLGVDDVIFYKRFSFLEIEKTFNIFNIQGFSLRFGKNITFCQPANAPSPQPKIINNYAPVGSDNGIMIYDGSTGGIEPQYRWEISASVYRVDTILDFLDKYKLESSPLSNPNLFEMKLAEAVIVQNWLGDPPYMGSFFSPRCSTITVNRVQDTCLNPVYDSIDQDPKKLNKLLDSRIQYDDNWYSEQTFDRIHIGEFKTK